jgi:hypothetical protein
MEAGAALAAAAAIRDMVRQSLAKQRTAYTSLPVAVPVVIE